MSHERSYTPPLVREAVNSPLEEPSTVDETANLSIEDQVKYLLAELKTLKSAEPKVSVEQFYTWENVPDFNPGTKIITATKWLKLLEQKAYFLRWDNVALLRDAVDKLTGRAREWYLTSGFSGLTWNDFKKYFLEIYDIDPQSIGTIFKSASMFSSAEEKSLVAYFHKKLILINKLSWDIPECDKINIIISSIGEAHVRQLALTNNYKTLDELLTFLRSTDYSRRETKYDRQNTKSSNFKISCYNCNETGHKKINCPQLRFKDFKLNKNKNNNNARSNVHREYNNQNTSNVCNICKKRGHIEKNCWAKKKINFVETHATNLFYKEVYFNDNKLYALIDTGSECSLIQRSVVNKLGLMTQSGKTHFIKTLSGQVIKINESVCGKVVLDEMCDDEELLVVPDTCCPSELLIGNTLIRRNNVGFVKVGSDIKFYTTLMKMCVNNISRGTDIEKEVVHCGGYKEPLLEVLRKFRDCIAINLSEMGKTNCTEMQIKLKSDEPVTYNPYRLSEDRRQKVQVMLDELLKHNIIRESNSSFASPVVLVTKPDGSLRMCIDYRGLNRITYKNKFPLPLIDDQIDKLRRYTIFTSLDLFSGYYQVPMAEESIEKTAFITPDGKFEFLRMSFGLCNAPFVFQQMITNVLKELPSGTAFGYLDDVIIPAHSQEHSLAQLKLVLAVFRKYNLTLQLKKCKFFMEKLNYLGREISAEGVRPDPIKVKALNNLNEPTNKKELQRFLGLAGYFRKFIKGYAKITSPLTKLLRKNIPWCWGGEQTKAASQLKEILVSRPVLKIYDPDLDIEVHTDASSIAMAAILIQIHADGPHPIAYYSKQCSYEQSRYHSYELETMAVVFALRHFRIYVLGKQFKIFTDCSAIRACSTKRDIIPRIARWWLELQEYTFEVNYRPGHQMKHVDCLSRDIGEENFDVNCVINLTESEWVTAVQSQDDEIKGIINILHSKREPSNKNYFDNYALKKETLYRKDNGQLKWVVPRASRWLICKLNHDDAGHMGTEKTLERIRRNYWFAQMNKFVKKYIQSCLNCLYMKGTRGPQAGYLHPIPKSNIPFETIHIDHVGPFVKTKKGNTHLLTIVDGFTKFLFLEAVKSTEAKYVIKVLESFIYLFGVPTRMISDRGSCFTSKSINLFCHELGIKHIINAVATPRANGQCERFNGTILDALRCVSVNDTDETSWDKHVRTIQLGLNTSVNKTTGTTPYQLLMGITPNQPSDAKIINEIKQDVHRDDLKSLRDKVDKKITEAQRKEKLRFDKKRKCPKNFTNGELVMVKITSEPASGSSRKLRPIFKGPFRIKAVLPNDRYVVEDLRSKGKKIDTVIAVDKIKPWVVLNGDKDLPFDL